MLRRDFNKVEYCRKSCFISSVSCQRNTTAKQRKAEKNSVPANLLFQPSLTAVSSARAEPTRCSSSLPEAPHHLRAPDSWTRKPQVCLQPCTAPARCYLLPPREANGTLLRPGGDPSPATPQADGNSRRNSGSCSSLGDNLQPLFHSPGKSPLAFVSSVARLMWERSRRAGG